MTTYASMRSRLVWLTEGDWRRFAEAVGETFPAVRYFAFKPWYGSKPEVFEPIVLARDPFELGGIYQQGFVTEGVLNSDWQPADHFMNAVEADEDYRTRMPFFTLQPFHFFTPERQQKWKMFPYGMITFYALPGNHEHKLTSQRFYRVLNKFCTNRNQVTFEMPSRKVQYTQEKGSMFWFGHDAIRWVNEDPSRYLHYNSQHWALRPMDPKNPPAIGSII